jgi:lysozyme family protein
MMKENYDACVKFVRRQEGGDCDTPGDRGGRTGRGGITHSTYDAYRRCKGLPQQDVWDISDDEIADIYRTKFWEPIYGDRLPAGQDLALFDASINSGPAKANGFRVMAGDGDVPTLIRKICDERLSFMHALSAWAQFGKDWGRRVAECEALALQMAGALNSASATDAIEKTAVHKRKANKVVAGGVLASAGAQQFAGAGYAVIALIIGATAIAMLIAFFNAWRHSQRADALSRAVAQMQAAQAAAIAAKSAVATMVSKTEKDIAAEEAALAAAKAAMAAPMPAAGSLPTK